MILMRRLTNPVNSKNINLTNRKGSTIAAEHFF